MKKEKGVNLVLIDGYRNAKMTDKLGIQEMPTLVELRKGSIIKMTKVKGEADLQKLDS